MECRAQSWRRVTLAIQNKPFSRSGVANLVIKDQYPLVKTMKGSAWQIGALEALLGQICVAFATQLCIKLLGRTRLRHDEKDVLDCAEHTSLGQVARAMYA